jgi:glycosyltransferase involved in cell wall biosynthesis
MTSYTLVSPVNDPAVAESCLLKSRLESRFQVLLQRGYSSAAEAYNNALDFAAHDVVIFAHQDVFIPPGWIEHFEAILRKLHASDPCWGVLGVYGVRKNGTGRGWLYSTGLDRVVGDPFNMPEEVRTLDEVLLIIRKSSGLRFDEGLPGFHMYGTDICLEAERKGLTNYAIPCFVVHNSNGYKHFPMSFWRAYFYVRKKWRDRLPIHSSCATVRRYPMVEVAMKALWRSCRSMLLRRQPGRRVANPTILYNNLAGKNFVPTILGEQDISLS